MGEDKDRNLECNAILPHDQVVHDNVTAGHEWCISGVLDWDEVLSVPLVISRKPPTWLWCNKETRSDAWTGDRDIQPPKDLSVDELTIKAHFDQIMQRSSHSYVEDTYNRGIWLRKLFKFGMDGFGDGEEWKSYSPFIEQWEDYYQSIARSRPDDGRG